MSVPPLDRKLLAILAADVVGFSKAMEADEVGTIARLKASRTELVDPLIAQYHGRIVIEVSRAAMRTVLCNACEPLIGRVLAVSSRVWRDERKWLCQVIRQPPYVLPPCDQAAPRSASGHEHRLRDVRGESALMLIADIGLETANSREGPVAD